MAQRQKVLGLAAIATLVVAGFLLIWFHWQARAQQQYLVLDTTRDQFLGDVAGSFSTSALTFTAVSRIDDGEVGLLPLGVVGDWEVLAAPLLPYPVEAPAAVSYLEPVSPFRNRIYLIGGYNAADYERLDTVYTCEVLADGSLTDWTLQASKLPRQLSSPAAAISTQAFTGSPITPTIYVLGGKYPGLMTTAEGAVVEGTSSNIYYAYIDPATLNIGAWHTSTVALGGPRLGMSAVANNGYLYAIGGLDDIASEYSGAVWRFPLGETGEPQARWGDTSLPGDPNDNPNSAYNQTVLVAGVPASFPTDTLYIIGGQNSANSTPRVLRGDIEPIEGIIQQWVDVSEDDLPEPLSAFAVAIGDIQGAGRQVYIIGGDQGVNGNNPQNTIRSAVVDDSQNTFYNWYGNDWLTSPALPAPRYRHAAVQVGEYIYAIAGHGQGPADFYRDVLRGRLVGAGARQYAPSGVFRSRVIDLQRKYRLRFLEWNSTMTPTDPGVTLTLQFRAGNYPDLHDAGDQWSDPIPAVRGVQTRTLVPLPSLPNFPFYPPVARYVQYRAFFGTTTAYSNVTPLLNEVGVRVEDSADLVVPNLEIGCDGCYGYLGVISRTIAVTITVYNQGGAVPVNNNFFVAFFLTTTADFMPLPPDSPDDHQRFLPESRYWGMQGSWFPNRGQQTVTTTLFYTQAQSLYLYAFADYNDEGEPPDYVVGEADPDNNLTVLHIVVIDPRSASETQTAWYWATQTAWPTPTPTPQWVRLYIPLAKRNNPPHYAFIPLVHLNYREWFYYLPMVVRGFALMPSPTGTVEALPTSQLQPYPHPAGSETPAARNPAPPGRVPTQYPAP